MTANPDQSSWRILRLPAVGWLRRSRDPAPRPSEMAPLGCAALSLLPSTTCTGRSVKVDVPPNRIDVISGISGVEFDEAWESRVPGQLGSVPVEIIGKASLLKNKLASGRPKDLIDAAEIERLTSAASESE